jgi:geranylgeranyl reductase family protein
MMIYDVLIVGAGPGGCAAAIRLAKSGWNVALLDKAKFPRDKVCGDFISPRSIRVLESLGALTAVEAAAPNKLTGASMYLNGDHVTTGIIPQVETLAGFGYVLPRYVFDEILFRQAQGSGVSTFEGARVDDFVVDDNGVTIQSVEDGISVTRRARLVIAADGAHSTLAKKTGRENRDSKARIVALRAYYDGIQGDQTHAEIFFDAQYFPGYAWIFPAGNGRANVGLGVVQDVYQRYDINLKEQLNRWIESDPNVKARLGSATMNGRVVGWPLTTYRGDSRNYGERILFVGDAGSFIDPINGEGIHTALESAAIAAGVADEALRANDLSDAFLSRYQRRWREAFDLDLRTSDFIVTVIKNRSMLGLWLLVLRMIGQRASYDEPYATVCAGILSGVVPTHRAISADIVVKTMMHGPRFWKQNLPLTFEDGVRGLLTSGLLTTSGGIDAVREMVENPIHTLDWGFDVAAKGLGVLNGLIGRYISQDSK